MSFYKNINIIRIVSDLKNGLPVCINFNKQGFAKEASKKFYFAKSFTPSLIEDSLSNPIFISTLQKKEHGKDKLDITLPVDIQEELLLKVLKLCEISPVLIRTDILPRNLQNIEIREFDEKSAKNFIDNFIYDLNLVSSSELSLKYAEKAEFFVFRSSTFYIEHYAIKIGTPKGAPLIRIHSSCYTGDLLASLRCDCRDQLQESIKFISESGGGYILYVMQEGRGIGLSNKIEAYRLQQEENMDTVESNLALGFLADERSFIPAEKMLSFFKIAKIRLITNNPKKSEDLNKLGIEVEETIKTFYDPNPHNTKYLEVKRKKMKHNYNTPEK